MEYTLKPGSRARFFHPRTLGVMHWGTVVRVAKKGYRVKFDVDGKTYLVPWEYF